MLNHRRLGLNLIFFETIDLQGLSSVHILRGP